MTTGPPYLARLGELQEDAAKRFFHSLPQDGWDFCTFEYREAGPVSEVVARATDSSGQSRSVTPPPALIDAFEELRDYTAKNGEGVWLSATLKIQNGRFSYDYNYNDRPGWRVPPTDEAYIEDLKNYPRPADQIPDWYPRGR